MTREERIDWLCRLRSDIQCYMDVATLPKDVKKKFEEVLTEEISELEKRTWNNHQVACLLADMFGDTCACNYNNIDQWLPELCDFKDTCCPKPVGVACWEQFLKHSKARYCECGYEMR